MPWNHAATATPSNGSMSAAADQGCVTDKSQKRRNLKVSYEGINRTHRVNGEKMVQAALVYRLNDREMLLWQPASEMYAGNTKNAPWMARYNARVDHGCTAGQHCNIINVAMT